MFYYLTNVFFGLSCLILLSITSWTQRKVVKNTSVKSIITVSIFVSISVLLTNFIGYGLTIFGIKIMLGNFFIFACGMIFGPFFGLVAGISSDIVGDFLYISSQFHFGYMFGKIIIGLLGGFVFLPKNNRFWVLRYILLLLLSFGLSTFIVTPISLASVNGYEYVLATYWKKLVTYPVQIAVYIPLIYSITSVSYIILKKELNSLKKPWFLKNEKIIFLIWRRKNK